MHPIDSPNPRSSNPGSGVTPSQEPSTTFGQHPTVHNSGNRYEEHTERVHPEGVSPSPQIQAEEKTELVRQELSTGIWESFTSAVGTATGAIGTATSYISEPLWKAIHQVRLAISDLFQSQAVKSTQSLLKDEGLKHTSPTDGTLKFNGQDFSMPHQFNRDLIGCRYYLGNEDLAEIAFKDLKENGMEGDFKEGVHPGGDSEVRLNAGLIIEKQFGHQGMLNIASILTQAATADLQSQIDQMGSKHHGREAGSKNATPTTFPEFHIQDQGGHVNMSMMIYLAVYPKSADGFLDANEEPSYVIGKREITISKEDLQKDWTGHQTEIAPSLKVNDSYSDFHASLDNAKRQMGKE